MTPSLSVAMIVKNEESCLENCLKSVQDADEIVILDTGSTDKTPEVVWKFALSQPGAELLPPEKMGDEMDYSFRTNLVRYYADEYKWNDDFSEARNYANSKCTGDWILTIDADDAIAPGGMEKIRELIKNPDYDVIGVKAVESNGMNYYMPLLFRRKPEIFWKGAIHNHLSHGADIQSDVILLGGHSPAHKNDPDRVMRILKKQVESKPELLREKFYLAREYRYREDWITALYWYHLYLKRATFGAEIAEAYLQVAHCFWELGRGDDARSACMMALRDSADFREALEFMAQMSGPIGREQWLKYAAQAKNRNVLFVRPSQRERDANYYDNVFASPYDTSRYAEIYEQVGEWCKGKRILDIGCGTAPLQKYVQDYHGFDFSKKAVEVANNPNVWVGDAYDPANYQGQYDIYTAIEVLEHLKDYVVTRNVPAGKPVIFSVPSFLDPGHVRCYNEVVLKERLSGLVEFQEIVRYNLQNGEWHRQAPQTLDYILLVKARRLKLG